MLKKERQAYILHQLQMHHKVITASLCKSINVCEDTVRRDLQELADAGRLVKVHGGALAHTYNAAAGNDVPDRQRAALQRIGEKAAALIQDNFFVMTTGGDTILEMARCLRQSLRAMFITGSLPLAVEFTTYPQTEVIIIGDKLCKKTKETNGVEAVDRIRQFRTDLCFIDVQAISVANGIMESDLDTAQLKKAMAASSRKVVCLATSNKLQRYLTFPVCELQEVDCLVTELDPSNNLLQPFRDAGIEVV
jgi:DeoR/GlpR family transcriptional regulator of sugar metabolism